MLIVIIVLSIVAAALLTAVITLWNETNRIERQRAVWESVALDTVYSANENATDLAWAREHIETLALRISVLDTRATIAENERDNAHRCLELVLKETAA